MYSNSPFRSIIAACVAAFSAGIAYADDPNAKGANAPKDPLVKCRVLVFGAYGKPNDVVEVPKSVAERNAHELDSTPAAVVQADKERALYEQRQRRWQRKQEEVDE